ncbi:hypothetical protein B0H16DRAFT_1570145 [Mycena metata]|uniref:Uncharacterized protein n=1 Tax=Mycena metata TaxID=1033252 RepID=A0AAD7IAE4_9AGAR|nr:hypothetical protein B0H16DRAFT_1570145 [Mycena metata]
MECTPEDFLDVAQSSVDYLSPETQAMLIRIGPGPTIIHMHGPPLSAETKGKIEHAIIASDETGSDAEDNTEHAIVASDEAEGDAALIEAEFELALDILDSDEISSAEPAAPANLNDPTAADAPVTLGPHGLSDNLPATVKPTSEFIATPIMKLWKLKFNPKYPAIYCDRCQQFVPLDDISPHLSNGWMLKEYSEPGKLKGKQHEKVKKVPTDLASQIRQELAATPETGVSIETRFPDSKCWKKVMLPDPGAIHPVEGLTPYAGIQCGSCNLGALDETGFTTHRKQSGMGILHVGRRGPVQTFSRRASEIQWFHVSGPKLDPELPLGVDLAQAKALLLAKAGINLNEFSPNAAPKDAREVPDCYRATGLAQKLDKFDYKSLPQHKVAQELLRAESQILISLVRRNFLCAGERLRSSGNLLLCAEIMKATQRRSAPCRPFFAPLNDTVSKYSKAEAAFIHIVLQETIAPTQSTDGSPLMLFSENQQTKLAHLRNEMNRGDLDEEKFRTCLNDALSALYFPHNVKSTEMSWQSPLVAYLYSQGIDSTGNFISAKSMGSFLATMQFAMRLRGHDNLLDMLDKFQIEEGEVHSNQWISKVHAFCETHLSEANYSPFAILRAWLRPFWRAGQNQVPASANAANWIDSRTVIISGAVRIGIDAFGNFVRELIKSTKNDIDEKVLFGIRLLDIGVGFEDVTDDGRMEPGYSPICSAIDFPHNSDSAKFILALLAGKHMGLRQVGDRLTWETPLMLQWKRDLDKAWKNLYAISHIVGGPEPLFGQQEQSLKLVTTVRPDQSVERRQVFITDGSISFITNRVAKRTGAAFQPADVIHLLPPNVSRLFHTLIRVVRPAAVSLMLIEGKIPPKKHETFLRDHRDLVFASMTADTMRYAIRTPFQETFGIPMTRPLYKNLALCLATRGVPTRKIGRRLEEEDPSSGIADRQAGRSKAISEGNYAILQEDHGMLSSLRKHQLRRIREWHRFLGL